MSSRAIHTYRPEIDGLRAVAVLSVVLFHAGVPGFSGGFVGVDVFFVISGYLITSIIAGDLESGRFSIAAFYERRIRRIFPALLVMLLASTLLAAFVLLPAELDDFGRSLAAATLFVSNVFFWQSTDYFAGPAHLKPLLHTWSLAVEEQFYVIFPLLLALLHRRWRRLVVPVIALLAFASLGLSVWATGEKPVAAFYLLPTRFHELAIGALLALGQTRVVLARPQREIAAAVGLLLIAGAVASYGPETAFPGHAALLPCLGTALVIGAAGTGPTFVARLLSSPPAVFVGLISYSLYLWHWPVLTFARIQNGEALSPAATALLLGLSAAIALLSWRYVERPFRERKAGASRRTLFREAAVATALLFLAGLSAYLGAGWPGRMSGYEPRNIAGLEGLERGRCFLTTEQSPSAWPGVEACTRGSHDAPRVVVWGDSFAAHLVPGLAHRLGDRIGIVNMTAGGCPPVPDLVLPSRPNCRGFNARALETIAGERPAAVVIAARWQAYTPRSATPAALQATIAKLREAGTRVVLVGQSPSFDFASPYDFTYRTGRSEARVRFDPALNRGLESLAGAKFADPMSVLCEGTICPLRDGSGFFYFDGGHLSLRGSALLAEGLAGLILSVADPRHERQAAAGGTPLGPQR